MIVIVTNKNRGVFLKKLWLMMTPLTFFLFVWIYLRVGWSLELLEYALLTSILLVITVIDIKTMEIPDKINWIGLILAVVFLMIKFFLYQESILSHILGFLVGGGIFLLIAILTNAMGGGDIKLMAVLGLWLGLQPIFMITVLSFFIGGIVSTILLVTGKKGRKDFIPYGPFIAAAAFFTMLYGTKIWATYSSFTGLI